MQGVGFRPFVYSAARALGLGGFVGNDGGGVFIEVEGRDDALEDFERRLMDDAPPLAHVAGVERHASAPLGETEFRIVESAARGDAFTLVSPDICVCDDCAREFRDPSDRRYLYPFINCTNCGPRFTITERLPYDRANTTMRDFAMCAECRREYDDPSDRRFHAQPNACPECGPQVSLIGRDGLAIGPADAFAEARARLKSGEIVAVKGIGGFHLACDARSDAAVDLLRERKGRADKPFAVMCRDLGVAGRLAQLSPPSIDELTSPARPIVLLPHLTDEISAVVAPGNERLGVMLPYAPMHFLLFDDELDALVMTSGNLSNEPIVRDNIEAFEKLSPIADAFLLHNRDIYVSVDDSVVANWELGIGNSELNDAEAEAASVPPATGKSEFRIPNSQFPIRRSRGYAPFPVELPFEAPAILAVGGELKATFCLTRGNFGFMSQHIGDMENLETLGAFERSYEQMKALFGVEPEIVVGDLHPGYISTKWAERRFGASKRFVRVQHHHAHIASVMAENGVAPGERVIGFAFDGTGYGLDGRIWGGEVFVGGYDGFERAAHLDYFPLAGGDAAVRGVYRQALTLLRAAGVEWSDDLAPFRACPETERKVLAKQLEKRLNVVETSSMGRLFDAVASLAGVRQTATYEAQAAIEFEALADPSVRAAYEFAAIDGETIGIDWREVVRAAAEDVRAGVGAPVVAAKFHNAVAKLVCDVAKRLRLRTGIGTAALSAGCFQNATLLARAFELLQAEGFETLVHAKVPSNDGGLALGQAALAAAAAGNDLKIAESQDFKI